MSYGKSSGGQPLYVVKSPYQPYQPSQQEQQQFAGTVAQQQPDLAQQLNQISGGASPAVSTMVNQQMAPGSPNSIAREYQDMTSKQTVPYPMEQFPNLMQNPAFNPAAGNPEQGLINAPVQNDLGSGERISSQGGFVPEVTSGYKLPLPSTMPTPPAEPPPYLIAPPTSGYIDLNKPPPGLPAPPAPQDKINYPGRDFGPSDLSLPAPVAQPAPGLTGDALKQSLGLLTPAGPAPIPAPAPAPTPTLNNRVAQSLAQSQAAKARTVAARAQSTSTQASGQTCGQASGQTCGTSTQTCGKTKPIQAGDQSSC